MLDRHEYPRFMDLELENQALRSKIETLKGP